MLAITHQFLCTDCKEAIDLENEQPMYCTICADKFQECDEIFCSQPCADHAHERRKHDPDLRNYFSSEVYQKSQDALQEREEALRNRLKKCVTPLTVEAALFAGTIGVSLLDDTGRICGIGMARFCHHGLSIMRATIQSAWIISGVGAVCLTLGEIAYHVYRWQYCGDPTYNMNKFVSCCAESVVANGLGCVAGLAGAGLGMTVGALAGPVGMVVGGIIGAFIGALVGQWCARKISQCLYDYSATKNEEKIKHKFLVEALEFFNLPPEWADHPEQINETQLKAKFRQAARLYHPDRGGTNEKCIQVYTAYATIRAALDNTQEARQPKFSSLAEDEKSITVHYDSYVEEETHVSFQFHCAFGNETHTLRGRYSHFLNLHKTFTKNGVYGEAFETNIPSFPGKWFFTSKNNPKYLEERGKHLEQWLRTLLDNRTILINEQFQNAIGLTDIIKDIIAQLV